MTQPKYDEKISEVMNNKLDLIKSFIGTDPDMALTVLTYAMAEVAITNDVEFHSIVKNVALIWEHVESQLLEEDAEGANDAND